MTPTQYRTALERLGLTQTAAAHFLKVTVRTANAYANGGVIPESTAKLLRLMVKLELSPDDIR